MRTKDRKRFSMLNRRSALLLGGQAALVGIMGARLFQLQVVEHDRYQDQATKNSLSYRMLTPKRGLIRDRYNRILVDNTKRFTLKITPDQTKDRDLREVLEQVAQIIPLNKKSIDQLIARHTKQFGFVPLIIREHLSWKELAKISVEIHKLPGIEIVDGSRRTYPHHFYTAPVTGYVGRVSPEEMKADQPLLNMPDFRIGKQAIEHVYDNKLRGTEGYQKQLVNAHGRRIAIKETDSPKQGQDLKLTLDIDLQKYAYDALIKHQAGAAVLLEVDSGAVRVLASCPSYNPNQFVDGIAPSLWKAYLNDPYYPLVNKAVTGLYAPGSTFKLITLLAALKTGISPNFNVPCFGDIEYGGHQFHCWKERGHGQMNAISAMRESCDVWFYEVAKKVGIQAIADMARDLGLGALTGIDLEGERAGLIPDPDWKRKARNASWYGGETLINAIGQGFVLATPLQLATMMARLAKGGRNVTPYLNEALKAKRLSQQAADSTPLIPSAHLTTLNLALSEVVNHSRGTAYQSLYDKQAPMIMGKTGTSQVRRITMKEREEGVLKNENIAWRLRDHALFVGLAPVKQPRYAVAVVVEHGKSGSSTAAPIAGMLLRNALEKDQAHQNV